ncbi:hypothetical protein [Absidia glauca]|uniref:Uncharacterized protein n=1 Tax=Absidia glauca TaxID=4829 RepID=A0A163MQV1_ABSGL|nr:hypothetical protein [Absidia glauca]
MTVVHLPKSKHHTLTRDYSTTRRQYQPSPSTSSVSIASSSGASTYKQYHNNVGTNAESYQMQHNQQIRSYDLSLYGGQILVSDTLYFEVPQSINDNDIVTLLTSCRPILIQRNRHHNHVATGWIRFASKEQADRAYTLYDGLVFKNSHRLQLYITPDGVKDQVPNAPIFQINHLPLSMTNDGLYNQFRPFGPIRLCKIIVEKDSSFNGTALLQYFNQQDADCALMNMGDKYIDGSSISIFSLVSNKPNLTSSPTIKANQKPKKSDSVSISTQNSVVDFTNLYIKNLDLAAKSADLYNVFRVFGHIISARVMKNPRTKQSRGYGFVSFTCPEDARAALEQFNGNYILSKPVVIAFHEPKRLATTPPTPSPSPVHPSPASSTPSAKTILTPPTTHYHPQKVGLSTPSHPANTYPKTINYHQYQNQHQHQQHRQAIVPTVTMKTAAAMTSPATTSSSSSYSSFNKDHSRPSSNDPSVVQRNRVRAAIIQAIGKDKDMANLDLWVEHIMSLRSTSRALCLFNSSYLLTKLDEIKVSHHHQRPVNPVSPYCCQPHPQKHHDNHHSCTTHTPKTPNLIQYDESHSHASSSATSGVMTTSTTDIVHMHDSSKQEQHHSMARFVESMKGLSLLQQKQQLGDFLFPHVKATGTKQASKVTIHLLDTQPLDQLAYSMSSMALLKPLVDKAFFTLTQQQSFIKAVMK